jgi:CAAX amino terminal protease family.
MTKYNSRKLNTGLIALYFVLLLILWSIRELFLKQLLINTLGEIGHEIVGEALKILIWTCPAIYLIKKYEPDMLVPLKKMFTGKIDWRRYLPIFFAFSIYNILGSYLRTGKIIIHPNFKPSSLIGTVLLVGITEEIVFRAFLLNATYPYMKKWTAITVNAVMFLVIHFPIWIYNGIFISTISSGSFVLILALSFVFSEAFVDSKNILVPISLHMFWNLLVYLFFG